VATEWIVVSLCVAVVVIPYLFYREKKEKQ
jgi:hypothetical protein